MGNPEGIHVVPTAFGGVLVETSNKHIISATPKSLAMPLSDTPSPKQEFPAVRMAHNSGIKRLMVDNNQTRFWRYARINGEKLPIGVDEMPIGTQIGAAIFSCGLTLCFKGPPAPSPDDPRTSEATSSFQRGYLYDLVPEIPCIPDQVYEHFDNPYGMSNFAAGTAAQDCLWMYNMGEKSVAPCGGWINLPWGTNAILRYEWIWLYLYGDSASVRRVEHGIRGTTTVGSAAQRLMRAEREALEGLALEGFRGRAVAVWPPIVANGTVVI